MTALALYWPTLEFVRGFACMAALVLIYWVLRMEWPSE